jgi:hypothetical protein
MSNPPMKAIPIGVLAVQGAFKAHVGKLRTLGTILLLASLVPSLSAQTQDGSSQQAISFVQHFYDWYLPVALRNQKEPVSAVAISRKPTLFDAPLLRALRDDAAAQTKTTGEIDGLDFDPFLNSQDAPAHYRVLRATGPIVTVIGFNQQISKPAVTLSVEVHCEGDHCVLVNFYYPADRTVEKTDLLTILRILHPHSKDSQ